MTLNKSKGNMYPWIYKTVNPIRGRCPHACTYCYVQTSRVKHLYQGEPHLVESFFEKRLGKGKIIFMGSCFDLFAEPILTQWIEKIFNRCVQFDNTYLFQTKNPDRFNEFLKLGVPSKAIYGTTIETTDIIVSKAISSAPDVIDRYYAIVDLNLPNKMISIEPIIDFRLNRMIEWMRNIKPLFVSIGADSKGHNLPEPPAGKIKELISELQKFTEVKVKDNLERLME